MPHSKNDHFKPAIQAMREQVPESVSDTIKGTACFGHLWMDDYGVCPEIHCDIRTYCQQVYQLVQIDIARDTERRRLKFNTPVIEDEARDPDKFVRKGYRDLNRDVDKLLKSFKNNLSSSFVFVRQASYHLVKYKNNTIARFWTNAKHRAIVDIVPEVVSYVVLECTKINSDINHIDPPIRVPSSSVKKLAPCSHRCLVLTEDGARFIALMLKDYFGV